MQSIQHVFSSREILLTEIYYNKIRSENIMILHLQHIKCVNLLACVPACACAIAHVSGNNSVDWCTRQEPLMKIFTISGKPSTPPSTCPQSFIIFSIPYKYHHQSLHALKNQLFNSNNFHFKFSILFSSFPMCRDAPFPLYNLELCQTKK